MEQFNADIMKQRIHEWGADIIGFADLKDVLTEDLSHLPVGISIGVRLSDQIIKGIKNGPTMIYAYHYSITNALLNEIALKTTNYLQNFGFSAMPIPASQSSRKSKIPFQHKTAATSAGIGWIGKSSMLIHPEYGPRLRYVTVLSDVHIEHYGTPIKESKCGDCKNCVDACPVHAIKNNNWKLGMNRTEYFEYKICLDHINKVGVLLDHSICGICIAACPIGIQKDE